MTALGVLFQMRITMALSSSLAASMLPSILMRSEVRMTAKRVAVKLTVPSGFNGMFMATRRGRRACEVREARVGVVVMGGE